MLAVFITSVLLQATAPRDTMVDVGGHRLEFRVHNGFVDLACLADPRIQAPMVVITSTRSMWNREREEVRGGSTRRK